MDDDDYRALIALVEKELRGSGLSDIADQSHYRRQDGETGDWKMYAPRGHLIALLEAFERHVTIHDHAIVDLSLKQINDVLDGEERVKRVICEMPSDGESRMIDLAEALDLSEVRQDLTALLNELRGPDRLEYR